MTTSRSALALACAAALLGACGGTPATPNRAPDGTIDAPAAANVTIQPGGSVTFQGSCADPDGDALTHSWTFSGGAAGSTQQSPGAVTFANAGVFLVTYTCTDAKGLADPTPDTRVVTVVANRAPDGTIAAPAGDLAIEVGGSVTFQGACSDPDGDAVTHLWTFGGGAASSTAQSPGAVTFAAAGTFTATYTCTDAKGLADPTPATRTVTVTTPNRAPDGTITAPAAATVAVAPGGSIDFQGACADPDGDGVTHLWGFGGAAAPSAAQSPGPVTFPSAGTFVVTYTCTDSHGLADPTPATRTVLVSAGNHAPEGFITTPTVDASISPGGSVTFAGSCSDPDSGDTVTHAWDFGGAAPSSSAQSPGAVTFPSAGTFTVTYTCTDSHGLADPTPATRTVTVGAAANRAPDGQISAPAGAVSIAPGGSVTFAGACTDPDGDAVTHLWTFGGGAASSTAQSPGAVTFAAAGTFTATYTCTDSKGLADPTPATRTITVTAGGTSRTLSGTITFDKVPSTTSGLSYAATAQKPVRGAEVSVVDAANTATVLATGATGEDGHYSLTWSGAASVKVVVYSRTVSPRMIVEDNTAGNVVYALASSAVDASAVSTVDLHAASGWTGSAYASRAAAPFAVLDTIWQAVRAFQAVRPSVAFPDLHANWSANNQPVDPQAGETDEEAYAAGHISTSHWNGEELYLLGSADDDTDEYDDHVVAHEWGHYFESMLSRSDSVGGPHGSGDLLDARVAFGEGWGNALSAMVWAPNTVYSDAYGTGQGDGFGFDVENNVADDPNPGWYSESSVQSILYDLFDSGTSEPSFDTVALGLGPIYDVLVGAQKDTPALTTLFSFISALKAANPSAAGAIDTLTKYRSVVQVNIADAWGTGETKNGGHAENLPLYKTIAAGATGTTVTFFGGASSGNGNELSQNRYLRFVGDGASHTVSITTTNPSTNDVDVYVYLKGAELGAGWSDSGNETLSPITFQSGVEYVIAVQGWSTTNSYTTTVKVN